MAMATQASTPMEWSKWYSSKRDRGIRKLDRSFLAQPRQTISLASSQQAASLASAWYADRLAASLACIWCAASLACIWCSAQLAARVAVADGADVDGAVDYDDDGFFPILFYGGRIRFCFCFFCGGGEDDGQEFDCGFIS